MTVQIGPNFRRLQAESNKHDRYVIFGSIVFEEGRESMQDWQERVTINPDVCHGKPCMRGTRIMVSVVLDNLAEGLSSEEIVKEYPPLTLDDIRAAISYAANLTREEEILPLR